MTTSAPAPEVVAPPQDPKPEAERFPVTVTEEAQHLCRRLVQEIGDCRRLLSRNGLQHDYVRFAVLDLTLIRFDEMVAQLAEFERVISTLGPVEIPTMDAARAWTFIGDAMAASRSPEVEQKLLAARHLLRPSLHRKGLVT